MGVIRPGPEMVNFFWRKKSAAACGGRGWRGGLALWRAAVALVVVSRSTHGAGWRAGCRRRFGRGIGWLRGGDCAGERGGRATLRARGWAGGRRSGLGWGGRDPRFQGAGFRAGREIIDGLEHVLEPGEGFFRGGGGFGRVAGAAEQEALDVRDDPQHAAEELGWPGGWWLSAEQGGGGYRTRWELWQGFFCGVVWVGVTGGGPGGLAGLP